MPGIRVCRTRCTFPLGQVSSGAPSELLSKLTVLDLLRKAKIDEFQMSFSINEYVLRLQISVRDTLGLMQILQYQHDFGSIEL